MKLKFIKMKECRRMGTGNFAMYYFKYSKTFGIYCKDFMTQYVLTAESLKFIIEIKFFKL